MVTILVVGIEIVKEQKEGIAFQITQGFDGFVGNTSRRDSVVATDMILTEAIKSLSETTLGIDEEIANYCCCAVPLLSQNLRECHLLFPE